MEELAPLLAENADITGFAKTPDVELQLTDRSPVWIKQDRVPEAHSQKVERSNQEVAGCGQDQEGTISTTYRSPLHSSAMQTAHQVAFKSVWTLQASTTNWCQMGSASQTYI